MSYYLIKGDWDMKKIVSLILMGITLGLASPLLSSETVAPIILDVRTVQEYERGHLEGAVLVPYDRIANQIGSIVKTQSQKVFLYCRTSRRSKIAKETLNQLGYTGVVDLGSIENASKILNRKIIVKGR
jgi:phage shock protein E